MDNPKQQLLQRLREANNILVTVSANPTVDQLSAAIGFTLLLNKLGKHATAVFSGKVPDVLEFLQPDKTLEKDTNSLRDFIIALDKSKADKLRYKVEDEHVKIFITPYRTALSEEDLDFSQGDFNVEVVVALGVHQQKELDQAIMAHGRILHDATVSSINNKSAGNLGSINWVDTTASSLCEMMVALTNDLKAGALDGQMATAFLTGIVSETKRFSNEKTTSATMSISSQLMAAGANQQLVAAKLQDVPKPLPAVDSPPKPVASSSEDSKDKAGAIQIEHEKPAIDLSSTEDDEEGADLEQIHIDERGTLRRQEDLPKPAEPPSSASSKIVLEPPTLGGQLTANSEPEHLDPSIDPLSQSSKDQPLLSHDAAPADNLPPIDLPMPNTATTVAPAEEPTPDVSSAAGAPVPDVNSARDAVENAVNSSPNTVPQPRLDLNAHQLDINPDSVNTPPPNPFATLPQPAYGATQENAMPPATPTDVNNVGPQFSENLFPPQPAMPTDQTAGNNNPLPPPPMPPPMMPPPTAH